MKQIFLILCFSSCFYSYGNTDNNWKPVSNQSTQEITQAIASSDVFPSDSSITKKDTLSPVEVPEGLRWNQPEDPSTLAEYEEEITFILETITDLETERNELLELMILEVEDITADIKKLSEKQKEQPQTSNHVVSAESKVSITSVSEQPRVNMDYVQMRMKQINGSVSALTKRYKELQQIKKNLKK